MRRIAIVLMALVAATAAAPAGCDADGGGPDAPEAGDFPGMDDGAPGGEARDTVDVDLDAAPPECTFAPDPLGDPVPPTPPEATDYLVVTADPLLDAAEELATYRASRGHTVEVIPVSEAIDDGTGSPDVDGYVERIRALVAERREALDPALPLLVLLLGDAGPGWDGDPSQVPTSEWRGGSVIDDGVTSDNLYVDLDGDQMPEAGLGRVPVSTLEEARAYVAAVEDYEGRYEPGIWNRQIHVFASEGGFGDVIDDLLEDVGMRTMAEVPPAWSVTFTYARQESPYTYPPDRFSERVYEYLNGGGFLMSYVGHGYEGGFADVSWPGVGSGPTFDTSRLDEIAVAHRAPLLVFIACLTGAFDSGDCISERILRLPRSSPAVVASTEISHPYANGIFVREIERVAMYERPRTLGDLFLRAKQAMVERDDDLRRLIDDLATIELTPEEMDGVKLSHLHMYELLGDPGLEPAYPRGTVDVSLAADRLPPASVVSFCAQVHGPPAGTAHVTFEIVRSELARWTEEWSTSDPGWEETVTANHESANDKVVWSADVPYANGGFGLSFVIPPETRRFDHHVVVYAEDGVGDAMGAAKVMVRLE